jgi:myo-inositol 2-dehydrogenase / D-chiro-inositol 1-dehydrogenase
MSAIRVLIIGCGPMGRMHGHALRETAAAVYCTDIAPAAARGLALEVGATPVPNLQSALKRGVDAAVVTTPTRTHAGVVTALVEAGIPCFCEKPLALTLAETRAVGELVDRSGVPLQIGFHRRCDAEYRRVRGAIRDGTLGRVQIVHARTHTAGQPVDPALGGSILRDLQIHDFDAVHFITGRETEAVSTFPVDPAGSPGPAWNCPAVASVLEMSDGSTAVVTGGRPSPPGYDARLEVYASRGSMAAGLDARTPMRSAQPGVGPSYARFTDRFADAYRAEMDAFAALVGNGAENPCTWQESHAAMRVAIAAERSAQRAGARVQISTVA